MIKIRQMNSNISLIVAVQGANAECQLAPPCTCCSDLSLRNPRGDAHQLLREIENCSGQRRGAPLFVEERGGRQFGVFVNEDIGMHG